MRDKIAAGAVARDRHFRTPSFVGGLLQHPQATVMTRVKFRPTRDGDEAGLAVLRNTLLYLFAGIVRDLSKTSIALRRRSGQAAAVRVATAPILTGRPVELAVATSDFAYRQGGTRRPLGGPQDSSILSTHRRFVGAVAGLYAHSANAK